MTRRRPEAVRRAEAFLAGPHAPAAGCHVLVAASGGPDSTALAAILAELAPAHGLRLTLGHVRHGLRTPADEAVDEAQVRALAARLGAGVVVRRVRIAPGGDVEGRARTARHRALRAMATEVGAELVALGHTRDDQAETLLMRLLRGAGRGALAGMRARRGRVIRPLIRASRADVRWYLADTGLAWTLDRTNAALGHTRNRVRRLLLPFLAAEFNPRVHETLATLAERLRDEDDFLEAEAARHAAALREGDRLRCDVGRLPAGLARRVIRRWLTDRGVARLTATHVERLLAVARGGARGVVAVAGPRRVLREGAHLVCREGREPRHDAFRTTIAPGGAVSGQGWRLELSEVRPWTAGEAVERPADAALLDADSLPAALEVRSPHPGDRVRVAGVGTRKLQDVLVDRKVPRERRAGLAILTAGEVLLWVPGVVRAAAARVGEGTRRVLEARLVRTDAHAGNYEDKPALPLTKPCGSIRPRSECT